MQIKKIQAALGEKDPGVTIQEFIVFQIFFSKIDMVKNKMNRMSFLEYDQFKDIFYEVVICEDYVKKNNVKVPEHICTSLFNFLDTDESGELEPNEIEDFNTNMMGKS